MFEDMDEQLELAHKVFDVIDRANRKNCVILLLYSMDKPENFYAQVRLIARIKEFEKIQQVVYVKYKLGKFIYLLDVMNSANENVIAIIPICNVLEKVSALIYS